MLQNFAIKNGWQFSISGRCNISFEQAESATLRKSPVDTRNVELYTRN